jgi:hypothetical protein
MEFRHIDTTPLAVSAALNRNRRALRQRIAALQAAPDAEFVHGFPAMVAAVETGFRHEEVLCELLGSPAPCPHLADHAVMLCALHRTMSQVENGNVELGRHVADALDAVLTLPWQAAAAVPCHASFMHRPVRPVRRGGMARPGDSVAASATLQ